MTVMQMFRMDGQVAFVNGAGRGIGAASALALAEAGADVAIRARTLSQLEETAEGIRSFGRKALVLRAVEDEGDDIAALDKVVEHFGSLHSLVNVVGGALPGPFMRDTDKKLNDAFEFNVTGPIRIIRAAVPHLLASGGGSVVNITTTMAHLIARGFSTYGTVKAALDHATRLIAADLAPRIRVNAVAPGSIHTESLEVIMRDPEIRRSIEDATPLRRLGTVNDIAAAVLYLCSPASSYMTGKTLHVDGGLRIPNFDMGLPDL